VTRVFSHDDDVSHLPSISEDDSLPFLSKQISPIHKEEARSIPIGQIDKELDGITLKSTGPAVTSSFVKIHSPPIVSPGRSPSPEQSTNGGLRVDMQRLVSPLDEKLKRHAGHTPMAFDGTLSTEQTTNTVPSPRQEDPPDPAPTTRPSIRPSENSDSYFSFVGQPGKLDVQSDTIAEEAVEDEPLFEPDEDPALKGPLMLDPSAKSQAANVFLEQVDAKLKEAAAYEVSDAANSEPSPANVDGQDEKPEQKQDDFPHLKIKKSTNFGSAWGGDMPGHI